MNALYKSFKDSLRNFAREDDGAQVIEYALIIAVISIALVIALQALTGADFNTFIQRVGTCLSSGACTAPAGGGGAG